MHDPATMMLSNLLKFVLSLLVPGGGQLFNGRFILGAVLYVLVVGSLGLVTRGIVRRRWPRVALLALAGLGFLAGVVESSWWYFATLMWVDRPWSVVLPALVMLLAVALVAVVPRPARRRA